MTYAYSATQGGMRDQIKEVCKDLHLDPWPYDEKRDEGARDGCSYLAGKIIEACRELLSEPTRVMEYIQCLAQHRMSRGLFLNWTTPSGFPVLNRYHKRKEPETFNLITYGIRVRHDISVDFEKSIWETKAINAAAANFVHSMDAAHLVKVINACCTQFGGLIRD